MENQTTFRIELDIAAQQVIHQFVQNNDRLEKELTAGFKKAIETTDIKGMISEMKGFLGYKNGRSWTAKVTSRLAFRGLAAYTKAIPSSQRRYATMRY